MQDITVKLSGVTDSCNCIIETQVDSNKWEKGNKGVSAKQSISDYLLSIGTSIIGSFCLVSCPYAASVTVVKSIQILTLNEV